MRKVNGIAIKDFRTNGEYVPKHKDWRKANGIMPHQLWRSKKDTAGHNRALLICNKKSLDWSIRASAIDAVMKAELSGLIDKGYVVFEDSNGYNMHHTISEVSKAVQGHKPNPSSLDVGVGGDYFYLDVKLQVKKSGDFSEEDL